MSVRHLEQIRAAVRDAGAEALWVHPAVDFRYENLVHLSADGPELLNAA